MLSFIQRQNHEIVEVRDTEKDLRRVCKCQMKERHINEQGLVEFPVFECPWLTKKTGFGTENGVQ